MCLGIESTAHTFGASLVDDQDRIVTNVNSTYRPPVGVGIHPRKASEHLASVADSIVKTALSNEDGSSIDPDVIAYAAGPGLGPCLRIGATVARALSSFLKRPLVPVHHGVAHLDIAMSITKAYDPLAVLVSGGHTSILVHVGKRWRVYGETQDITLGNLLDMFAREARLPSPGGLSVGREAMKGQTLIKLPYTVKGNDVAYSALLTAATSSLHRQGNLRSTASLSIANAVSWSEKQRSARFPCRCNELVAAVRRPEYATSLPFTVYGSLISFSPFMASFETESPPGDGSLASRANISRRFPRVISWVSPYTLHLFPM